MTQNALKNTAKYLLNDEGQSMVEYILILSFIAMVVVASLTPIGKTLAERFTQFAAAISGS